MGLGFLIVRVKTTSLHIFLTVAYGVSMQIHEHAITPFYLLKGEADDPPGGGGKTEQTLKSDIGHGGKALVCKVCHSRITRPDLGMRVNGEQRHVFFNPHGYVFEIGCFASAKNLAKTGPKTDEFTWFPGYAWQAVGCTGCATLLGWRYTGQDDGFYGLILKALIEEEGRKA